MPTSQDEKKTINDLTTTSTSASSLNVMVQGTSATNMEKMSATDLVNGAIDDDVLMSGDEVPTNPATVNADQLNGVPDTGYVKKYATSSADWDATPTDNSTKPVTSGGVYDAISALSDDINAISNGKLDYQTLQASANNQIDLNEIHTNKMTIVSWDYSSYQYVSNKPYSGGGAGTVICFPYLIWFYGLQLCYDYQGSYLCFRVLYDNVNWSTWKALTYNPIS